MALAAVLTGCTLAPKYARPVAPIPAEWPTGPAYGGTSSRESQSTTDLVPWRDFFTDPNLRQLIEVALANNRDLRVGALNVERARAFYGIRRAELLPTVDGNASGSRQRLPADLSGTGQRTTLERYDANLGVAAWELDFFGRIRSLKDRALEEFLASEQARRSAQLLLVSSVAQAYLALAADRESLALAETTLQAQQGAYNLIRKRFQLGLVPELDLFRAQTQVDAARGDIAAYTQVVAQDQNALQLLLGTSPPAPLLPPNLESVTAPVEVAPGLPSDVLLRRPDVLQAESLLRAAYADIGAARAAFFPRITLTAAFGTASTELQDLFSSGSAAWSYAPRIVMPIFDARTWSAHKAAKVQREIALTQYEGAIQAAFRDVSDALAVSGTVDAQLEAQRSFVKAVSETYRLANSRYERGIDSYLAVLDAQRSLYSAEQLLLKLRLAKAVNQVILYRTLGGGWDAAPDSRTEALFSAGTGDL